MQQKTKLTKRFVESFESVSGEAIVWDSVLPGFGLRVRGARKSFIVQRRAGVGRFAKQKKVTLGVYPAMTAERARALALRMLGKLREGESPTDERRKAQNLGPTVSEICDLWRQSDAGRSRMRGAMYGQRRDEKNIENDWGRVVRHIKPLIGDVPVRSLTPRRIEKFRDDVAAGKTAAIIKTKKHGLARVTGGEGTASKTVRILSTILSFAVRENMLAGNPAFGVRKTPTRQVERFLSAEEMTRLEKALKAEEASGVPSHGVAVIRLLLLTGCRKREIEALKWSEVDLDRGFLRWAKSKTGRRVIPLSDAARELIGELPRFRGALYVFPSLRKNAFYVGTPQVWRRVRDKARLHDVRLHDLRHTFASVAAAKGLSLPIIGALLGHSQASTTMRYAHLADHSLKQATEVVAGELSKSFG